MWHKKRDERDRKPVVSCLEPPPLPRRAQVSERQSAAAATLQRMARCTAARSARRALAAERLEVPHPTSYDPGAGVVIKMVGWLWWWLWWWWWWWGGAALISHAFLVQFCMPRAIEQSAHAGCRAS